jgi:hypothetical protein
MRALPLARFIIICPVQSPFDEGAEGIDGIEGAEGSDGIVGGMYGITGATGAVAELPAEITALKPAA